MRSEMHLSVIKYKLNLRRDFLLHQDDAYVLPYYALRMP